jgi:hypothetical protein
MNRPDGPRCNRGDFRPARQVWSGLSADRDRHVLSARSAAVPLGAYSEAEVIAALGAPVDAVRPGE